MQFAKVYSAQPHLLEAQLVTVEADIARGLHAFAIVGLPDKAVEEARDRVASAIKNTGYTSPKSKNQKIVIALAPADLKKEGPVFDIAVALAYLKASGDLSFDEKEKLFLGELALDGAVRPIGGTLACALKAKALGFTKLYVPKENAVEAALIDGISVFAIGSLRELIEHLDGTTELAPVPKTKLVHTPAESAVSLDDIRGQESAKRGLQIAAAGGHNLILFGPPGTGKTMLAKALAALLPPLSFDEVLEVTAIHSSSQSRGTEVITTAPFRSPHHTASYVSLVGGGTIPKPGEVTLAHRGVLFLDEFPEFERRVIDALRQPLEDRVVSIARARGSARFPARFIFIAAMNPCPCGNAGSHKHCMCLPHALERYRRKISGPIIDRMDMWIEVPHVPHDDLVAPRSGNDDRETRTAQEHIKRTRARQYERFGSETTLNSDMSVRELESHAALSNAAKETLSQAAKTLDLSPRSYHRTVRLSRTIADMDESDAIEESHILEALQYRPRKVE